jgi:hypothetical protein
MPPAHAGHLVGGFPATVTNPAGETTSIAWDGSCAAVTSTTDANTNTTSQTYDALPAMGTTYTAQKSYDAGGYLQTTTYPDGDSVDWVDSFPER